MSLIGWASYNVGAHIVRDQKFKSNPELSGNKQIHKQEEEYQLCSSSSIGQTRPTSMSQQIHCMRTRLQEQIKVFLYLSPIQALFSHDTWRLFSSGRVSNVT